MLKRIWDWLVTSSADPKKLALTVRSLLLGLIPVGLVAANMAGFDVSADAEGQLKDFVDSVEFAVVTTLSALSAIGVVFGLARKIYHSFK